MATLIPREPYTKEELEKLYPKDLQLQLVQVGKELPRPQDFEIAKRLTSAVLSDDGDSEWDQFKWRRRLETFGEDDNPMMAAGPKGEMDIIWQDPAGRQTTLRLGRRLRYLYVKQLGFMPDKIGDTDMIYLRTTPLPRTLESLQQSFLGMYPRSARLPGFREPTIITRWPADETLYPNDNMCKRLIQLISAFTEKAAERWDGTKEMDYLNNLISKWMPPNSPRVSVDSHPSIVGILDTVNATLAHGTATRLPKEFYDAKGLEILDRIGTEAWFAGYKESSEFRTLGVGPLLGDIVSRMVSSAQGTGGDGQCAKGRGREQKIKFALSGAHDTTLSGILASLGTFEGRNGKWPPYTSHIAMELFRKSNAPDQEPTLKVESDSTRWYSIFRPTSPFSTPRVQKDASIARKPQRELSVSQKKSLAGYYVRLRYNDRPIVVEGCRAPGNHLEGDESFCTLEAFKAIVDKFTPVNWRQACLTNLDKPAIPPVLERPGI